MCEGQTQTSDTSAGGYHEQTTSKLKYTLSFFFLRTSNFGGEAVSSYIFLRFKAENVLKMFLNLHDILCITW